MLHSQHTSNPGDIGKNDTILKVLIETGKYVASNSTPNNYVVPTEEESLTNRLVVDNREVIMVHTSRDSKNTSPLKLIRAKPREKMPTTLECQHVQQRHFGR